MGAVALLSSCSNVLSGSADPSANAARYFQAQIYASNGKWTEAIAEIAKLTSDYSSLREVQVLLASAYAGRCGLNMISLSQTLANTTNRIFPTLFTALPLAKSTAVTDCQAAEDILNSVAAAGARTVSENLLMMFIGLTKIGVIISNLGDTNLDGVLDAAFLPCNVATGLTVMPKLSANRVATAIGNIYTSAVAIGNQGSTVVTNLASGLAVLCAALQVAGGSANYNVCTATAVGSVIQEQRQSARALLAEDVSIGLSRPGGNISAILPACVPDP